MLNFLAAAILLGGFILWMTRIRGLWRGDWTSPWDPEDPPRTWPYGAALWAGFVRLTPISGVLIGTILILFVAFQWRYAWLLPIQILFSIVLLLVLAVAARIVLFNRPKWAVTPELCDAPGAFTRWRARWRGEPPVGHETDP